MINQIKKFLKNDKILHMICCFAIVVIFGLVLNIVSGITLALIASFGKEAYEVAFDMVGFGLASWDFIDRSYNKGTKQLTEMYRYNVDSTSHYQLCIKKSL